MRSSLVFIASAAFAPVAHAGFFVADGPAPVPVAPVVSVAAASNNDASMYKVPFAARSSQLSAGAKRSLGDILTAAQGAASVSITGCGDANDSEAIAYRRASAIKGWLIDNGVSPEVVSVKTDSDSSTLRTGRLYNCSVATAVNPALARAAVAAVREAHAAPMTPTTYAPAAPAVAGPAQAPQVDRTLDLMRSVLQMAATKAIDADDAIAMLQQIAKASGGVSAAKASSAPPFYAPPASTLPQPRMQYVTAKYAPGAPTVLTPAAPIAAVQATVSEPVAPQIKIEPVAQTWTLDPNQSLKDTLSRWARSAGWKEPVWNASKPYRIADGGSLSGGFLDALRTVANAVPGLDMKANPTTHELTITDAAN